MSEKGFKPMHRIIEEIIEEVRERKVVSIPELSNRYGYSYSYFRYHLMKKVAAASNRCVELKKDVAIWVC